MVEALQSQSSLVDLNCMETLYIYTLNQHCVFNLNDWIPFHKSFSVRCKVEWMQVEACLLHGRKFLGHKMTNGRGEPLFKGGVPEKNRKGGIVLQWQARLQVLVFLEYVPANFDSRNHPESPGIPPNTKYSAGLAHRYNH